MTVLKMEKEMLQNSISSQFQISPNIWFFRDVDLSQYVSFNDSTFQNVTYSFESSTAIFTINFDYSENAENKSFNLSVKFSQISNINSKFIYLHG